MAIANYQFFKLDNETEPWKQLDTEKQNHRDEAVISCQQLRFAERRGEKRR